MPATASVRSVALLYQPVTTQVPGMARSCQVCGPAPLGQASLQRLWRR